MFEVAEEVCGFVVGFVAVVLFLDICEFVGEVCFAGFVVDACKGVENVC